MGLFLKALFGVVGFICLLLVGALGSGGNSTATVTTTTGQTAANLKPAEPASVSRDEFTDHRELDLNSVIKRRIPNGPDPIHNRRAGNSGRPPGQS